MPVYCPCSVFGLSYRTDEQALREEFSKCALLRYVKLCRDRAGRSRGFGFVTFYNTEDATAVSRICSSGGIVKRASFRQRRC